MLAKNSCKQLIIEGVVQGVGFRPFVFNLANSLKIFGSVCNKGGFVEVFACGLSHDIKIFTEKISANAPPKAKIERITVSDCKAFEADSFLITESGNSEDFVPTYGTSVFIQTICPDLSICAECEREILDPENRRFGHFFNSCVNCGPRFSVIENLPYDRENTSMYRFELCENCTREYNSPKERRFNAQTICCNSCGPVLRYIRRNGTYTETSAFEQAVDDLKSGRIIAVKGIGGYHLACLPIDKNTVETLRKIKNRGQKPLAVMFESIDKIKEFCKVSKQEETLLLSDVKPIVLLDMRDDSPLEPTLHSNGRIGCFLPYTPLHCLLLNSTDALVMTSANISESAIIIDDDEVFAFFGKNPSLSGILCNNRKIVRGIDDSVMQINAGETQIIRAARGMAPARFEIKNASGKDFLAVGGDLKAAFCLVKNNRAFVSQYFGDLENSDVYERFSNEIESLSALLDITPQFVVCDRHPAYFSTELAKELAKSLKLPVLEVQHHFAHAASVLSEHGIYGNTIGVCFDGTGFGDDGRIWGGEFLLCGKDGFERVGHLRYFNLIGADGSARDAKRTALCFLLQAGANVATLSSSSLSSSEESIVKAALSMGVNSFEMSSVGRLFDAVCAILGICFENTYEGQCAIALQQAAEFALENDIPALNLHFGITDENNMILFDPTELLLSVKLFSDKSNENTDKKNNSSASAALGFHIALANAVSEVCGLISEKSGVTRVALTGGVFQNRLLTQLSQKNLHERGMSVFVNRLSPPGDGGISLGQAYLAGLFSV